MTPEEIEAEAAALYYRDREEVRISPEAELRLGIGPEDWAGQPDRVKSIYREATLEAEERARALFERDRSSPDLPPALRILAWPDVPDRVKLAYRKAARA